MYDVRMRHRNIWKENKIMAEKTAKKNTKGTKKAVEKKVTKKASPKKETKKVIATPKKEVKAPKKEVKAAEKEVKVITTKEKKEGKIKAFFKKIIDNRPFAISLCIILVLIIALTITLFAKRIPKTSSGSQIVASIKGKNITADDLYLALKKEYGTEKVLDMVDSYIISDTVKFTEEEEQYIQDIVDSYSAQAEYYNVPLSTLLAGYGINGVTNEREFYDFVVRDVGMRIAVAKFIGNSASEDELKDCYKNYYSDTLVVRHILIEPGEDADAAYDKAMSIIGELDGVSASDLEEKFSNLAKKYSEDGGSYGEGGLIENVTITSVVPEFFEGANNLKDGEYTKEPVKSSYGYHIIYRVSSEPVKKYEDIKEDVRKTFGQVKLSENSTLLDTKLVELRDVYKLNIIDTDIKNEYEKKIK